MTTTEAVFRLIIAFLALWKAMDLVHAVSGFASGFVASFGEGGHITRRNLRPGGSKPEKPDSLPTVSSTPEPPPNRKKWHGMDYGPVEE